MKKHLKSFLALALGFFNLPAQAQSSGLALDRYVGTSFIEVRLPAVPNSVLAFGPDGAPITVALTTGLSLSGGQLVLSPAWSQLSGVPSTFTPSAHNHIIGDVTGLQAALDGKLAASAVSAFGLTLVDDLSASAARATLGLGTLAVANSLAFADLTSKPTTLAGYGITDPIVLTSGSYANPSWLASLAWSKITGAPTSLAGYGITDPIVLTSGSYSNPSWLASLAWSKITGAPTTLAGYGIADPIVLTSGSYADPTWITSLAWAKLTGVPSAFAPSAHSHIIGDVTGLQAALDSKLAASAVSAFGLTLVDDLSASAARTTLGLGTLAVANSLAFADLTSKPTTLAGYGITDPIVLTSGSYANPAWLTSLAWSKITGAPTTLAGYGIADPIVLTSGSYADPTWITSLAWAKLTGVPSTFTPSAHSHIIGDVTGLQAALDGKLAASAVSAFGLTLVDDLSASAARSTLGLGTLAVANSLAFADLTSKPTTLAGYGITDPIVLTSGSYANPSWLTSLAWSKITGAPTTLAGYGITDPVVLTSGSYADPAWITSLDWSKITGAPSATGDVTGPSASVANYLALADGTTGKAIKYSEILSDGGGGLGVSAPLPLGDGVSNGFYGTNGLTWNGPTGGVTLAMDYGSENFWTMVLPPALPASNGMVLVGNTSGYTSWVDLLGSLAAIKAITPTKGKLLAGNGTAWVEVSPATEDNQVLLSDSGAAAGVSWGDAPTAPPPGIGLVLSDETTSVTTGTAKVTFRMPRAMTLAGVRLSATVAPTGSTLIADVNEGGVSIFSTRPSLDAGEKTSTTAATAAVLSDTSLADDAEITVDLDQVGSTVAGKGIKIWLIEAP